MRTLLITLVSLAFMPQALADLTVEYAGPGGERSSALYIKGEKLRMDTFGKDRNSMIFDATKREITIIEHAQRRYTVIDQATIAQMRAQMEQAMAMVERMGVSREQMAQMMPGMPERVDVSHRRTGEMREVGGHTCEIVVTQMNGEDNSSSCVASTRALGIAGNDFETLKAMSDMLTKMAQDILPGDMLTLDIEGMDGLPLESYDAAGNLTERLTTVGAGAVDAALFTIPSGMRRQNLDFGG